MAGLVKLDGYDEAARRHRWTGETLPVPYHGPRTCRRCGFGTLTVLPAVTQDALFAGGGYGASVTRTTAVCEACGRTSELRVETVRPPRKKHP